MLKYKRLKTISGRIKLPSNYIINFGNDYYVSTKHLTVCCNFDLIKVNKFRDVHRFKNNVKNFEAYVQAPIFGCYCGGINMYFYCLPMT